MRFTWPELAVLFCAAVLISALFGEPLVPLQ